MPSPSVATPKKVLSAIHNIPRKMKSGHLREQHRARGKENIPPGAVVDLRHLHIHAPTILITSPSSQLVDRQKWLPRNGMIIIKVAVPCADDLWKFKVAEDITLDEFTVRVETKVGFPVVFASKVGKARERPVTTEHAFRSWVASRVRAEDGRNVPLVAHVRM